MDDDTLLALPRPAPARVLALGAYLKNGACRIDGSAVVCSPNHGDLATPEACTALEASAERLLAMGPVDAVAHDLHPDFPSTRLAVALAERLGVPAIAVQHHHAHIAAVQAEAGVDGPLVGLALDGVGLGSDDTPWGGELLVVDGARWRRAGHLQPLALPGGDIAAREPWRLAVAVLHALGRADEAATRLGPVVGEPAVRTVLAMLDRGLNTPRTTSAGRWFDAAAGLLGLSVRQAVEAEAAIALERAASEWLAERRRRADVDAAPSLTPLDPDHTLQLLPLLARVLALGDEGAVPQAAALFHVQLADALVRWATGAARAAGLRRVALGGGCFFNRVLRDRVGEGLARAGLALHVPQALGFGDAGLAIGQAWVAADTLRRNPALPPAAAPASATDEALPCA